MRALIPVLAFLFTGCVIIEEVKPQPQPVPVPVPEPVPFPGSGLDPDPGLDQLWLIRVDPGTANLAAHYEALVRELSTILLDAKVTTRTLAVASLYDGQLLWAAGKESLPTVGLADTLRYYSARASGEAPRRCTTSALAELGANLSAAQVTYPADLAGFESQPYRPFVTAPGAFLVVVVDSGARPLAPDSSACWASGLDPVARLGGGDPATWLRFPDGETLSRAQTRFLFLATSEGASFDGMRAHCAGLEGFPQSALDAIEPSPTAFFDPLSSGLNGREAGLSERMDFCEGIGGKWPEWSASFAKRWAEKLLTLVPEKP